MIEVGKAGEVLGNTFPDTLFSHPRQDAIVGHLLLNSQGFFLQSVDKIEPDWFLNRYNSRLWSIATDFYRKYKRPPTVYEVVNDESVLTDDQRERDRIISQSALAQKAAQQFGLDAIKPDLTDWMHQRIFLRSVTAASAQFNGNQLGKAYLTMKDAVRTIESTTFEDNPERSFEDYEQQFNAAALEYETALTFGINAFDRLLDGSIHSINHEQAMNIKRGSLLRGDMTLFLAPTNVGKTTAMITVLMHNLMAGKNILLITHEGRPEDIQKKIWCSLLGVKTHELMAMYDTSEGRKTLDMALSLIKERLVYIPMNKAGLSVEEVVAMIRLKQEERAVTRGGKGFDLLINDYPAKLISKERSGRNDARRVVDEYIYNQFVQLGLEYKFHVLCAIQTNREGSRVNRGEQGADRLITMEDVMESWGPMTAATNVISINRDPVAMAKNVVTFYICKSRSSETGWAMVCVSDYGCARTHAQNMGGTWYRGTSTMTDKIETLLKQYPNQGIPAENALTGKKD